MPPLDDELRAALHGRAATLAPSPDPLAGVERRARGMRRRRVAASVAGTALAVAAVVGAVPLLSPDRTAGPDPSRVATAPPSPAASRFALDPGDPWPYRGVALPESERDTLLAEWQAVHPGGSLTPLFGQVWEPSQQREVLFVDPRSELYGYAQGSEAGWTFRELALPPDALALPVVLGGDETLRAVVVASPDVERVDYAADGSAFTPAAALAAGVATFAVEQAPGTNDLLQVVGPGGELVTQGAVADEPAPSSTPEQPVEAPANVQDWEGRGVLETSLVAEARQLFAQSRRAAPADVLEKVLFAGDDDAGRRYLLGQFWLPGDAAADTVGVVLSPDRDPELQLYRPAGREVDVLALHLSPVDAQSRGELVVVPRPGTGQVQYAGDDASEWVDKDTTGLDGVVLLSRNPAAERGEATDRLRLLDGDGRVFAEVVVADLLCGRTSCS